MKNWESLLILGGVAVIYLEYIQVEKLSSLICSNGLLKPLIWHATN